MAECVAEREEINSEAKERKRKRNFSVYEIGVITENVKKHLETIQSKLAIFKTMNEEWGIGEWEWGIFKSGNLLNGECLKAGSSGNY